MTLVVTVNGPDSIWLLADRRLSAEGRPPKDDGRKIMCLETSDGVAILGYAGLGATALGTEPADWMSAVLRGRNLPLEPTLNTLAEAMKREFPPHMIRMPGQGGPAHHIIIPAFLGNQARLFTIDLVFAPDRSSYNFRHTRHEVEEMKLATGRTPRLGIGGTGALYLVRNQRWIPMLLRLVRANDRDRVSTYAVADYLAALNNEVYLGLKDKSVGPRCIVAWRHKKNGVHKGGGGHQFYTGAIRDINSPCLPTICAGLDIKAYCDHMTPRMLRMFEEMLPYDAGKTLDDLDDNGLYGEPDENFR